MAILERGMTQIDIWAHFIQIKRKSDDKLLNKSEMNDLFLRISDLNYDRDSENSRCRPIGNYRYSLDIEEATGKPIINFFAGKEREAILPKLRCDKGKIKDVNKQDSDNILEPSHGCIFFDEKIENGAIVLLQKNYFGCSIRKLVNFLELFENGSFNVDITLLTKHTSLLKSIEEYKKLRYVTFNNVSIEVPTGFGDLHANTRERDEIKIRTIKVYTDYENMSTLEKLEKITKYIFKNEKLDEKNLKNIINDHGMKLVGIKNGNRKQEETDFTKNMTFLSYKTEKKKDFNKSEFYEKCKELYENHKEELLDLSLKIDNSK